MSDSGAAIAADRHFQMHRPSAQQIVFNCIFFCFESFFSLVPDAVSESSLSFIKLF